MLHKLRAFLLEDRYRQGIGGPPNNFRWCNGIRDQRDTVTYNVSFNNDAFEIWIGEKWDDEESFRWAFHCRATVFRQMALWYLWRWAWGEWFGLRRWLFYKDLRFRLRNFPPFRNRPRRL